MGEWPIKECWGRMLGGELWVGSGEGRSGKGRSQASVRPQPKPQTQPDPMGSSKM